MSVSFFQSPVNGQVTPDVAATSGSTLALVDNQLPFVPSNTSSVNQSTEQSFLDPLQTIEESNSTVINSDTTAPVVDTHEVTTASVESNLLVSSSSGFSETLPTAECAMLEQSMIIENSNTSYDGDNNTSIDRGNVSLDGGNTSFDGGNTSLDTRDGGPNSPDLSVPSVMTSTGITNLPPVPSNMYNISSMAGVEDSSNSMDLFESCVEDAFVRPFNTVSLTAPQVSNLFDDAVLFC